MDDLNCERHTLAGAAGSDCRRRSAPLLMLTLNMPPQLEQLLKRSQDHFQVCAGLFAGGAGEVFYAGLAD
jgi:hypothetical protein